MIPLDTAPKIPDYHIVVDFGAGIPSGVQGPVLLAMERTLREQGYPAEVLKQLARDDNKRRRDMTPEERARL